MKVNFLKSYERDKEGVWQPISSLCVKEEKMEYKLLIEERSKAFEIQKKLNVWKDEFAMHILAMCPVGSDSLAILIKREKVSDPYKEWLKERELNLYEKKEERRQGDGC